MLEGFPDNKFQITEHSPAVAECLATSYLREREEDTVAQFEQEHCDMIDALLNDDEHHDGSYNDFAPPRDVVNSLKVGKIQVELHQSSHSQRSLSALTYTSDLSRSGLIGCIDKILKLNMLGSFES